MEGKPSFLLASGLMVSMCAFSFSDYELQSQLVMILSRKFVCCRDELGERTLLRTVQEDLGLQGREQHLLVIQGLEQYNKVC